jgi:hypothetical protein
MDDGTTRPDSARPEAVRPELETLVRALAALTDADRRNVVSAAERAAVRAPTLPWDLWERAEGVVTLGGNAVEDCDRLYDGT